MKHKSKHFEMIFEKVGTIIKIINLQCYIYFKKAKFYYFQGVITPMRSSIMCKLILTHRSASRDFTWSSRST